MIHHEILIWASIPPLTLMVIATLARFYGVGGKDDHTNGGSAMVMFALALFLVVTYFLALGVRMMFLVF